MEKRGKNQSRLQPNYGTDSNDTTNRGNNNNNHDIDENNKDIIMYYAHLYLK